MAIEFIKWADYWAAEPRPAVVAISAYDMRLNDDGGVYLPYTTGWYAHGDVSAYVCQPSDSFTCEGLVLRSYNYGSPLALMAAASFPLDLTAPAYLHGSPCIDPSFDAGQHRSFSSVVNARSYGLDLDGDILLFWGSGGGVAVSPHTGLVVSGEHRGARLSNALPASVVTERAIRDAMASGADLEGVAVYQVRQGVVATDRDAWEVLATYPTGKEAADSVKLLKPSLAADSGLALCVHKHVVGADTATLDKIWKAREAARFKDGTYQPFDCALRVPDGSPSAAAVWRGSSAQSALDHFLPDFFIHKSTGRAGYLAFTADAAKGRADSQKRMSVPAFLNEYGSAFPDDLLPSLLSAMTGAGYELEVLPDMETTLERLVVIDKDGNLRSCMSHSAGQYATDGIHPYAAYVDGPDLRLACLWSGGIESGSMVARCLVWPEKGGGGVWGRIYGEGAAMRQVLKAQGYVAGENGDCFLGARLARIDAPNGCVVMPYIDYGTGVCGDSDADWFVLSHSGDMQNDNTDGAVSHSGCTAVCYHCEENYDDENTGSTVDDSGWCDSCVSDHAAYCHRCEEYTNSDNAESVHHGDYSETYCSHCTCLHATSCDDCGDMFSDHRNPLNDVSTGESVCDSCLESGYCYVESEGEYVPSGDVGNCSECSEPNLSSVLDNDHDACPTCLPDLEQAAADAADAVDAADADCPLVLAA